MYCSRKCRETSERTRERLDQEAQTLLKALKRKDLDWEQERAFQQALSHRRWALERYPAPRP
ncbi:hypothetical protein HDA30_001716 [Micrococcus cohnii]|uniref:Uncharacterized protein n=1 Tax=Micrococcus cohnii TaxID=993416 RepID=A0A7W7GQ20_9MICC|nr:hypothetical protein [Micrococcus cohnii]TWH36049.1 hypothetical protein L597_004600000060 [Micrococcus luteus J28]